MSKPTAIQESTRYDRQIRVWGAEAQSRLQNAKVLLINFTNLNVEVVLMTKRPDGLYYILIEVFTIGCEESSVGWCWRNHR